MDSFDPVPSGGPPSVGTRYSKQLSSCVAGPTAGALLSMTLSGVFVGERHTYLARPSSVAANGFRQRRVNAGDAPTRVADPRTRTGDFRSAIRPGLRRRLGQGRHAHPGTGRPVPGNALHLLGGVVGRVCTVARRGGPGEG